MIKCFPRIIIIRGLSHERISHRKPTEARIVQVAKRVRRNLRNKLLHHRRARLPLRNRRRRLFRHVWTGPAVQVRRPQRLRIGAGDDVVTVASTASWQLFVFIRRRQVGSRAA